MGKTLNTVLMWVFTICIFAGLILSVRNADSCVKSMFHPYEVPILLTVGLLGSIIVGTSSSRSISEGFAEAFGF